MASTNEKLNSQFHQFSCSVVSKSLWPHRLQHTRPLCPSPITGDYSNSCPLSWWCHPTISSSVIPFSSQLQSFPASGSFPMSHFFVSGGQSIGASASVFVLPVNIQDWFLLGLIGFISLVLSLLYGPAVTSVHDYWKNHGFEYIDLCQQNDVSAF